MNRRFRTWILATIGLVALAMAIWAIRRPHLGPDFMRYALVSQQIAAGHGIRQPIIWLVENRMLPDERGTVPLTEQPPFYPLVLACLGGVRPDRLWPAKIVAAFAFVMIALLSGVMGMKLLGERLGLITGLCVAVAYPIVLVTHWLNSEPLFMALCLGALVCLWEARRSRRRWLPVLLGSLLGMLAIGTRFAGVAWVVVFGWECLRLRRRVGWFRALAIGTAMSFPSLTIIAALFLRNRLLTGDIRGVVAFPLGRSWLSGLLGSLNLLCEQLGWWSLTNKALGLGFLLALGVFSVSSKAGKVGYRRAWQAGLDLPLVFAAGYLVLLTQAMVKYQYPFEFRFATPLLPILLICLLLHIRLGFLGIRQARWLSPGLKRCAQAIMALVLLYLGYTALYKPYPGSSLFYPSLRNERFLANAEFQWLMKHKERSRVVATNVASGVAFFGGMSALSLPSRSFDRHVRIPTEMQDLLPERMRLVGAKWLVLLTDEKGLDAELFGEYVARLSRRQPDPGKFEVVHDSPDGVIYELR